MLFAFLLLIFCWIHLFLDLAYPEDQTYWQAHIVPYNQRVCKENALAEFTLLWISTISRVLATCLTRHALGHFTFLGVCTDFLCCFYTSLPKMWSVPGKCGSTLHARA
jgi:hypothetical protein